MLKLKVSSCFVFISTPCISMLQFQCVCSDEAKALDIYFILYKTDHQHVLVVIQLPQDPADIAASIKALAKSVHGDANVFGDLPRPRFSTQI